MVNIHVQAAVGPTIRLTDHVHVLAIVVEVGKHGARIALALEHVVVVEFRLDPGIVPVMGLGQNLSQGIVAKFV